MFPACVFLSTRDSWLRATSLSILLLLTATPARALPVLKQDLVAWTETTVATLPDEDTLGFSVPTGVEILEFQEAAAAFLAEDWATAETEAADVGYEVVEFHDSGNGGEILYGLFPEASNTDGRGYFLLRPRSEVDRLLLLEAPHPRNDRRTAVLSSEIFRASGARAFFFAGTHRCANTAQFSGCSGDTSACADTEQGFLNSDMAHTEVSFFHAFHELAAIEDAETVTVQVHGFSSDSTDPEFTVSDGSRTDDASFLHLPNLFAGELEAGIIAAVAPAPPAKDGNSCNRVGDINLLCGTVNTQGRFINGSAAACATAAAAANGFFMHLELSYDLRHPGGTLEPQLVIDALTAVIPDLGGEIGGRVWADLNGNGLRDGGEPVVEGAAVDLYLDGAFHASTSTGVDGAYLFGGLLAGDYQISVPLPAGYDYSPQDAGTDDGVDSDVADTNGFTPSFFLAAAAARFDTDAGLVPQGVAGEIGDRVWEDLSGEGLQDAGEPGIAGIEIDLLGPAGGVVASTTTAADGSYSFVGLLPGSYRLRFDAAGWGATQQVPDFPDLDSDLDPQTGMTEPFFLGADQVDLSRDAGFTADCLDVALVSYGSVWRTLDAGSTWNATWLQPAFGDGDWVEGQGQLGFPTSRVNTAIADTVSWAYYFRHAFTVDEPSLFQDLELSIYRDDAAVVYLNGVEVLRSNLPAPPAVIGPDTRASSSSRGTDVLTLPASLLQEGENVLAVEVHQRNRTSSSSTPDLAFDLELAATVCNPCRVREVDFTQVRTTHLREEDPNDDFGGRSTLWLDGDAGNVRNGLLAWEVTGIPADAEVLHAEIRVQVDNDSGDFYPLYALRRAWDEADTTWQQATSADAWAQAGAAGATDRAAVPLGVVALPDEGAGVIPLNAEGRDEIEAWVDGSAANHGFVASHPGQTDGVELFTEEGGDAPVLRVVYLVAGCGL